MHSSSFSTTLCRPTTRNSCQPSVLIVQSRRRPYSLGGILLCLLAVGVSVVFSEGFSFPTKRFAATATRTHHQQQQQDRQHFSFAFMSRAPPSSSSTSMVHMILPSLSNNFVPITPTHHHHHHPAAGGRQMGGVMEASSAGMTTDVLTTIRGGGGRATAASVPSRTSTALFATKEGEEPTKCPFTKSMAIFGSLWGSFGVIYVLAKAIKRVLPIAIEPFVATGNIVLTPFQWSLYGLSCAFFAYAEGYKGFHTKFSPLVVKRSFSLLIGTPQGNNPLFFVLAPLYSMGLIHATKKRLITSWSVTIGVAAIVSIVKRLSPIPRCILDAGVIVGLSVGSLSILYHYIRSVLTGSLPDVDACLPEAPAASAGKSAASAGKAKNKTAKTE